MPHGLDHLDRDELVERTLQRPIVFAEHRNAVCQAGSRHLLPSVFVLLAGDGGRGDAAAVLLCGVKCETAPTRADFQHVVIRRQGQLRQMRSNLATDAS